MKMSNLVLLSVWLSALAVSGCGSGSSNSDAGVEDADGHGGGFNEPADSLKATNRDSADPATSRRNLGLRCAGRAGTLKID